MSQLTRTTAENFRAVGYALVAVDVALMVMHLGVFIDGANRHDADLTLELNVVAFHFIGNFIAVLDLVDSISTYLSCGKQERSASSCKIRSVESTNCFLFSVLTSYVDGIGIARAYFVHTSVIYKVLVVAMFMESVLSAVFSVVVYVWTRRADRTEERLAVAYESVPEEDGGVVQPTAGAQAALRRQSAKPLGSAVVNV
jgi:hypothetical protein